MSVIVTLVMEDTLRIYENMFLFGQNYSGGGLKLWGRRSLYGEIKLSICTTNHFESELGGTFIPQGTPHPRSADQ